MIELKITANDAAELNRELSCLARDPEPQPPHEPGIPREVVLATIARIFHALDLTGGGGAPCSFNKVAAIRQIRTEFELGLKECKDLIEGVAR